MQKLFMGVVVVSVLVADMSIAMADQYVRGYFRRDGTYVQPHYRSDPDGYFWNNYSAYGNINPYTGKRGYKRPSYSYGSGWNTYSGYGSGYGLYSQRRRRSW